MSADRIVVRRRRRLGPGRRMAALAVLPLVLGACDWFTDFKSQPHYQTWEPLEGERVAQRANPVTSVPITGMQVPAYVVSYANVHTTVDSMSGLRNPTPISEESLRNGRMYYQLNCTVCHGPAGKGNGPVTRFGFPGIPLTSDLTRNRTDGYLFGIIRNGRGIMPTYNRIEEMDRWDVVNYVRALQGIGGFAVDTLPYGTPGQTGAAVPGATRVAPTRPVPFFAPDSIAGSAGSTSPTAGQAATGRGGHE